MMELEDVGRDVLLTFGTVYSGYHQSKTKIIMIIKAPRGTLALFDNKHRGTDAQCKGIKAFMEQHSDD